MKLDEYIARRNIAEMILKTLYFAVIAAIFYMLVGCETVKKKQCETEVYDLHLLPLMEVSR